MLSAVIPSMHSYPAARLAPRQVHQRHVQPGPLVLGSTPLVSAQIIDLISFGVAFSIISFLHIVVGELMPKSMAIRQAERLSLWTAAPLYGFYWLMYPAIYVLNASANLLLKVFKLDAVHHGEQAYSSEELKLILKASHSHGELTQVEADMLEHTLDFADLQIADVMRPVDEMVALDINATLENNLALIMTTRYSRYPVYLTERNHIIGILHIKDLFVANQQPQNLTNLKPLLRPIMRPPQSGSTKAIW